MKGLSQLTIRSILQGHAKHYPNHLAVVDVDGRKRLTYQELDNRVNRLSHSLLELGIKKDDKIALFMNDCAECLEIMYAANKIGAIWTLCNYRFTYNEAHLQIDNSDAVILFFHEGYTELVEEIRRRASNLGHYVIVGNDNKSFNYIKYESLFTGESKNEPDLNVRSEDVVGIIYTSGTTGRPKGACHSNQTILGWALCAISNLSPTMEDRILNPYPMFHMGGAVMSIIALFPGATNYIFGKFDPVKYLELIDSEKITKVAAIPTIIQMINSLPKVEKEKYSLLSLRTLLTSGAPFLTETQNAFTAQWPHVDMHSTYSATEAYFSNLRPVDQDRKVRCVGPAVFGMDIKIMDDKGNALPSGEVGVVYTRGISTFEGYYKNNQENAKIFKEDWFTCEDMGYIDDEGFLYLVDRKKDMIISGGENISSIEVEQLLVNHPAVLEVAVIGVPHEQWGESVHAVVALKPHCIATPEGIVDWCKDKISGYKRPRSVSILDELPKNPTGKVLKKILRDEFWKGKSVKI